MEVLGEAVLQNCSLLEKIQAQLFAVILNSSLDLSLSSLSLSLSLSPPLTPSLPLGEAPHDLCRGCRQGV